MAVSAVLSLLIAGAMLLAVSDCLRSCSQVELSQVLDVLAEKASNAAASAGSSGGTVRDPEFQDAAIPSVSCSAAVRIGDPCARTLRDVPVRR